MSQSTPPTTSVINNDDSRESTPLIDRQEDGHHLDQQPQQKRGTTTTTAAAAAAAQEVEHSVVYQRKHQASVLHRSWTFLMEHLKPILYGGMDGLTAVFVSVATIYSGNVSMAVVLVIGVAKLLSGALSMGIGDYMSSKAELDLARTERQRELWECENYLEGEKEEMIEIYEGFGLRPETARKMVNLMATNTNAFVDVMMAQELGLSPDLDAWGPLKAGLVNFSSFYLFGSVPLILYGVLTVIDRVSESRGKPFEVSADLIFGIDVAIFLFALVVMGLFQARVARQNIVSAIFFSLLIGIIAVGSGYGVAFILEKVFNMHNVG